MTATDPRCKNCGHSRYLHFKPDAYVPGKCDFQYDLCSCRNYEPDAAQDGRALAGTRKPT